MMIPIVDINGQEIVAEYEASGKPLDKWCKEKNIPMTTFLNLRRMRRMNKNHPGFINNQRQPVTIYYYLLIPNEGAVNM